MNKRTTILLLFILMSFSNSFGQMSYSIRAGINGCNVNQTYNLLPKYKITPGITARIKLGKHSCVSLSLNYSLKAFQYWDSFYDSGLSLNTTEFYAEIEKTTLEVPLLYEFHFTNGFYLGLGQFVDRSVSFIFDGRLVYHTNSNEPPTNFHYKNQVNRFWDRGPCLALGIDAENGIGCHLLYTVGREVFKPRGVYGSNIDLNFNNLAFTLSYSFSFNPKPGQYEK